ncbi:MAG: hypothetical protein CVU65_12840 [Deltaproteobacteria bacterium HGW-Deltaproteobacteria-22]|nr:MAG: hypothetical protein CVU65_12840 [Deltaproteobacteria bacterium HGW-Deltaproteobacteria-22]
MLVPKFWAEHREVKTVRGKKATVRRFGWSDENMNAAQEHARARVEEALAALAAGESLARFEPKVPYNGADGVPIREEIVESHDDVVVTRNSYGALCLNTPDVLFADVDLPVGGGVNFFRWIGLFLILAGVGAYLARSGLVFAVGVVASFVLPFALERAVAAVRRARGVEEKQGLARIRAFSEAHPHWVLRVYRTPAGFRVLVMHGTFAPDDPAVTAFFEALGTDRVYVRMCRKQKCFRARVSPKPWRIGQKTHILPSRGVWPVSPEVAPRRRAWIAEYDSLARDFASCRFVEELGAGRLDPKAEAVRRLHDDACRAHSELPLA